MQVTLHTQHLPPAALPEQGKGPFPAAAAGAPSGAGFRKQDEGLGQTGVNTSVDEGAGEEGVTASL